MGITHYLALACIIFFIGAVTVITRRSAVISLMGVEMMLNAANLALVAFATMHGSIEGQVMAFFIMVVAAAEVVVGLAIVVSIFKSRRSTSLDEVTVMKH
ncbi:MAG: NADH-quinone oxidoreductase subunit NuoK [Varibaculum sp.]|nr:NADH-quinone oxidoreductase subunit NuoK [Varibaculum sp.]